MKSPGPSAWTLSKKGPVRKFIPYYKNILILAYPLLLGQVGNISVGFADNIMVGHSSTAELASASFVNNWFNIAIMAALGFAYGLTPLLGALFAKNETGSAGRLVRVGLRVNVVFSLTLTAIMTAVYFNLDHFGQPEELMVFIKPYYLVVLAGLLPITIFGVFSQWSYAIGNTSIPTWILLSGNALNILGNYVLIFGHWGFPALGLLGAGISTLVVRLLCMTVMGCFFFFGGLGRPYREGFYRQRTQAGERRQVWATGFPVAMQMTFETASFSGSAIMAGWIGALSLAAFQIVVITGMLGFCIYYSIGGAMAIVLSHAAGRHDKAGMRRCAWAGYHITLGAMLVCFGLLTFAGPTIMGWFSDDPAVVALAITLILPMILYQFGDATQINFANALRGTSRTMPMLYIAFLSYVVIGLPCTYLFAFPFGLGLYGIILSFTVCLLLAGIFYFYYFMRATRSH